MFLCSPQRLSAVSSLAGGGASQRAAGNGALFTYFFSFTMERIGVFFPFLYFDVLKLPVRENTFFFTFCPMLISGTSRGKIITHFNYYDI